MTTPLLQHQRPGANQVGEPAALLGRQDGVNLLQRLEHSVADALGARNPQVAALGRLGGIKGVAPAAVLSKRSGAIRL